VWLYNAAGVSYNEVGEHAAVKGGLTGPSEACEAAPLTGAAQRLPGRFRPEPRPGRGSAPLGSSTERPPQAATAVCGSTLFCGWSGSVKNQ
jgi:hypothetical protein